MRYRFFAITVVVLGISLFSSNHLSGSPASPAMLDANGCHKCEKVCGKYGLTPGQQHCHIFSPEAREAYQRGSAWAATNDETQFGTNAVIALDYVSITDDKQQLLISPTKKSVAGMYNIVSQSCGFGGGPATIKKGAPNDMHELFGVPIDNNADGFYTYTLNNVSYPAIFVADHRMLIVRDKEHILCSGQMVKKSLYLYCKGSFTQGGSVGEKGYCRTSLEKK